MKILVQKKFRTGGMKTARVSIALLILSVMSNVHAFQPAPACPEGFAGEPGVTRHVSKDDINSGQIGFLETFEHGKMIFSATFNECDGVGRPAIHGCGGQREPVQPLFHRLSGPDASSCIDCHNQPRAGGGGDTVMNVFFHANCEDPVADEIDPTVMSERGTIGMFGSGPIDMLANEMNEELKRARVGLTTDGWHSIVLKGVTFEVLLEGGRAVDAIGLEPGVNFKIRPFEQDGRVVALRPFTTNILNVHHGIEPEGGLVNRAGDDLDGDGISPEMTTGDISALVLFQAALGTPSQVLPTDPDELQRVNNGEQLFSQVGCDSCHIPALELDSPLYNDGESLASFDMTTTGEAPRLEPTPAGGAIVRAYTDLKLHNLCDHEDHPDPIRYYCNEQTENDGLTPHSDWTKTIRPGNEFFLTKKLWEVGNSAPYGHQGTLTTLYEAITLHAGEAREVRDAYVALNRDERLDVVKFLKTLQIPNEAGTILVE